MDSQPEKFTPEYLILGHISRDLLEGGSRPGGTALYSGILAQRMGLKVGLITSCKDLPDLDELTEIEIINLPADSSTAFNNQYSSQGREQFLTSRAKELALSLIPENWLRTKILHLGPIAQEIKLPAEFPSPLEASIAYSLQGWLREWTEEGKVYPIPMNGVILPTENRTAAFLSLEDLGFDRSQLDHLRTMFPLLVLTKGEDGTEIFQGKEIINIPADQAEELDPTGAGDIFAAGFMIYWVFRRKSIREAGRLASRLATISITRPGLDGIPTIAEINKIEQN